VIRGKVKYHPSARFAAYLFSIAHRRLADRWRRLKRVDTVPENTVGRWMKAQFNATDVTYSPFPLTSDPPKKLLAFTLETTHYSALLSLTPDGARLVALRR
jgi:DNA-directed RNA polymerase specialized sigma24 family protein